MIIIIGTLLKGRLENKPANEFSGESTSTPVTFQPIYNFTGLGKESSTENDLFTEFSVEIIDL